jgi:hypothetical protein
VRLSSDLHHASVNRDLSSGNKAALVAGKEESCGGDLLGAGEASERNEAGERLAHLVVYAANMAVSVGPGLTTLTRMPRGANSLAQVRAKERTAALVAP